jgi:hypothetical protein
MAFETRPSASIDLQRETEEKARQPETKLGAIAQTPHTARLAPKRPRDEGGPREAGPASLHGLVGQVPEQRQGRGPKAPEGLDRHRHEGQGGGHREEAEGGFRCGVDTRPSSDTAPTCRDKVGQYILLPVPRPVCGFGESGSASLCVA